MHREIFPWLARLFGAIAAQVFCLIQVNPLSLSNAMKAAMTDGGSFYKERSVYVDTSRCSGV